MITDKQKQYIRKYAFTRTSKDLGNTLNLNEKTIRNYKKSMFGYAVVKHRDFKRTKDNLNPLKNTKVENSYIAGFIDGEGTIGLGLRKNKRDYMPYISIINTNKKVIMWLKSKLKIKNITLTRERRGNWRNCYILRINGFGCLPILNAIMPYLLIKKKNAILLKEYIESRLDQKWRESYTHRHHKIFLTIKKLNKKGKERNA